MKAIQALLASTAILATAAPAATVISNYDNSTGPSDPGFLYLDKVIMSTTDSWSDTGSVGSWSYRDLRESPLRNQNEGWGHAATWYLVELTETTQLTVSMSSSNGSAWAGFVIYAGESLDDDPNAAHKFSNNGQDIGLLNGGWDFNGPGGTPGLAYVGHAHAESQTPGASGTWTLGPGLYTIAFGNADDSSKTYANVPYSFSLTTVPEPSPALFSLLAAGVVGLRRRRR